MGPVLTGLGLMGMAGDFFAMLGERAERAGEFVTEECGLDLSLGGSDLCSVRLTP